MMDYLELLRHSYKQEQEFSECAPECPLEFLSQHIFDFTTYDSAMDKLFGSSAVQVCEAIQKGTTFDFIKSHDNYICFLAVCNSVFMVGRITWGTSIRGAFWEYKMPSLRSCGLWDGEEQLLELDFSGDGSWARFMDAVIQFSRESPNNG